LLFSIPYPDDSCPAYPEGIVDDALPDDIVETYSSFVLVVDPITLAAADGSADCYPFADSAGLLDNYPESNYPQCEKPSSSDGVCAIQYTAAAEDPVSCPNRRYAIASYPSIEEAESAGAVVTHSGACGVCSNLEDFAMRLANADTIETTTVLCSVSYALSREFDTLVSCYQDKLHVTEECSKLWAHYSATNVGLCANECASSSSGEPVLIGPPPECELSECLQCSNSTFQADFDVLSGRTLVNSGITGRMARSCKEFFPVVHDPCVGNATFVELFPPNATMPPTAEPNSGGKSGNCAIVPVAVALLALVVVGWR
jgi:hypothetical protein